MSQRFLGDITPWLKKHFDHAPKEKESFLKNVEVSDEPQRPTVDQILGRSGCSSASAGGSGSSSLGVAAADLNEDPLHGVD